MPDALDVQAGPVDRGREPTSGAARLSCTSYPTTGRSSRRRRTPLEEATGRVDEAEQELAEVERSVEPLNARRLQLQGEADELRRRLAAIEDDVDHVDDELEEAEEARDDARGARGGRRTQDAARAEVGRLRHLTPVSAVSARRPRVVHG